MKQEICIKKEAIVTVPRTKIQTLLAQGKIRSASVVLMNNVDEFSQEEFNALNKKIKGSFPKPKSGGDYPTSCGKNTSRHMPGGHGHR